MKHYIRPKIRTILIFVVGLLLLTLITACSSNKTPNTASLPEVFKRENTNTEVSTSLETTVSTPTPKNSQTENIPQPAPEQPTFYPVVRVIDGDTLEVYINGQTEKVRLIGVDTPETVHPSKPVECFGIEASNKAKAILEGKSVRLESDPSQGDRDKYQRLLRYVFLEDNTNFNQMMIKQGYAHEYTYNLPYKYQAEFKQAEEKARTNKAGLWADGVCDSPEPADPQQPEHQKNTGNCRCDSNIYNCVDFSTQAEAQALFECCGGTSNDVHKLDRDGDGKVCESLP